MRPLGIRHRILLAALAPTALVAFLVSGILLAGQVEQAEIEQHRRLKAVARQIASSVEYNIFVGNTTGLQTQLETATHEPDVIAAAILDPHGRILASTVPVQDLPASDRIHSGFESPGGGDQLRHWHSQPVQALGLFVARLERDARRSSLLPRIRQLAQSVRTLQGLLDTLLDYSRLSGQVYRIENRPVRASAVIAAVHAEYQAAAAEKNLELRQHVADCWLMTDAALLHRILLNLVSNALRHTHSGGVLLACRRSATHARIEVWDTGSGIPPEQQEAVFEELVQLDNPERDASKGLGLGLAIVRRTALLLNHPVRLRSRVGHGSCFSITLPLAEAPTELHPDGISPKDDGNEILVFGKAGRAQTELIALIESWGHVTRYAPTVADALDSIALSGAPALVIHETDDRLPDTLDTLDTLDHATGQPLPALLIHPGPLSSSELRSPLRRLLSRPFRPARLRALIDHLLNPVDDTDDDAEPGNHP